MTKHSNGHSLRISRRAIFVLLSIIAHLLIIGPLIPSPISTVSQQIVELDLLAPAPKPSNQPGSVFPPKPPQVATRALRASKAEQPLRPLRRSKRAMQKQSKARPRPSVKAAPGNAPRPKVKLRMRAPNLDLRPDWPLSLPEKTKSTRPTPRRSTVKQKLDRLLAEDQARLNVYLGSVDPKLYDIQRDTEVFFQPTWALSLGDRRQIGTVASTTRSFLQAFGRNYVKQIKRYSSMGRPRGKESETTTMLDHYNHLLRLAEDNADRLRATLCVTVGWKKEPQISVRASSHRRPFDKMAKRALLRAVKRRPVKINDRPVRACYRISAGFHRIPPLPLVGCTFDEVMLDLSCYYPLKKILGTDVKLLDVHYLPREKKE